MPWNEPGGDQQDPWTGKKRNSGKDGAEELINKLNKMLSGFFRSGRGDNQDGGEQSNNNLKGIVFLAILLLGGWLVSGFYTIDARQEALVLRFGAYQDTVGPGLHWHLPYPVERVEVIDVAQNRSVQDRSIMLTKDENIVDILVEAQYRVRDPEAYAFNVEKVDYPQEQSEGTIYQVMRSAIREVVGRNSMDAIIIEDRAQIAIDAQALMQRILDGYKAGIQIIKVNLTYAEAPAEVKDAFDDANKARENANQFKNEADTDANRVVPEARGNAARMVEDAKAYRGEVVARAEGDAARFSQLAAEYQKAPQVTRERLYLETMESVLQGSRKIILDTNRSNNLLYLPLDQLTDGAGSASSAATAAAATAGAQVMQNSSGTTGNGSNTRGASNGDGRSERVLIPGAGRTERTLTPNAGR